MPLAIFGKKKADEERSADAESKANGNGQGGAPKFEVFGDKARKFFDHAKALHDSTNYEYAMKCWLDGLRQDVTSMRGLEGFFASAALFLNESGGKGPSKDLVRSFSGRGDLEKLLTSLLDWGMKPLDPVYAVRAAEASARLELPEQTYWIGERALGAIARDKRPRKDLYLKMMAVFSQIGAFDMAVTAGDAAVKLDPADGKLAADVRNLSAQATMSRGGYDQTGQAGGFRANIKDAEKQRHLDEGERIVKSEETIDRLLKAAEEDFRKRPDDVAAVNVYLKRLVERGRPEDERRARTVAKEAFVKTKQFRFRQIENDIVLRWAERKVQEYKDAAAANPDDADAVAKSKQAQIQFAKMQIDDLKERVQAYPTDLTLKFELGQLSFDLERYEEAIPLFQEAKADSKLRVQCLYAMGRAFQELDHTDEAIFTFRQARETYRTEGDEMGLNILYGLMTSLQAKAEADRELEPAEEADKLASSISIQQFNFKDVRARRDILKKLIAELKRGPGA